MDLPNAVQVAVSDVAGNFAGTDVEAVLAEIGAVIAAGSDGVLTGVSVTGGNMVFTRSVGADVTISLFAIETALNTGNIQVTDTGNFFTATNVEGVLQELGAAISTSHADDDVETVTGNAVDKH